MNSLIRKCVRNFSLIATNSRKCKITICGAAGNLGRIISYCLKISPFDIHLSLFDTSTEIKQIADQLRLINTPNSLEEHVGPLKLRQSLKDSDIVAVVARSKPNPNKTFVPDTFEMNFPLVANIARCCMEICPEAILAISTNPLNSIIPGINELFTLQGYQHSHKILGITAMDLMQAGVVYAEALNIEPVDVFIPLTGGTTADTIAPIFSQAAVSEEEHPEELSVIDSERLHNRFLVKKKQANAAEFATGYAISQFIESIVRALNGERDVVETAFVAAPNEAPARYLISMVDLDQHGIETVYGPPKSINRFEKKLLYPALLNLQRDIIQAEQHAQTLVRNGIELRMMK
ncbi:malate dehydrogenase, mitochondrial-like [Episyrphus balteatus]|uniref:malate dehydrogenase, mitochondrial-like n=1 Tax=Episyrphus balteatus TaxID=286459 RepID=UPI0024857657|nr:malate dehydrogenase, mitochondrial-like [Episyrphus balteatus]